MTSLWRGFRISHYLQHAERIFHSREKCVRFVLVFSRDDDVMGKELLFEEKATTARVRRNLSLRNNAVVSLSRPSLSRVFARFKETREIDARVVR